MREEGDMPSSLESWLLQDPGTCDAHDELVITEAAAKTMRAFSYEAEFHSETLAFSSVYTAPRWVVSFCALVAQHVWRGSVVVKEEFVVANAGKFILRGLKEPDFASALFVVLREHGLAACAALVDASV